MKCDRCGAKTAMAFTCNECGESYCTKHRLPESHDCTGLKRNNLSWDGGTSTGTGLRSRFRAAVKFPATAAFGLGKIALIAGAIVLVAGVVGVGPLDSPESHLSPVLDAAANASTPNEIEEKEVERLIRIRTNEARGEAGLVSLSSSDRLREQAQRHSKRMAEEDELAHNLPGSTTGERLNQAGCMAGAENVAQSWVRETVATQNGSEYIGNENDLANSLVRQWLNSPEHRDNMLSNDWSQIGVGVEITSDGKVYATQKFCA